MRLEAHYAPREVLIELDMMIKNAAFNSFITFDIYLVQETTIYLDRFHCNLVCALSCRFFVVTLVITAILALPFSNCTLGFFRWNLSSVGQ